MSISDTGGCAVSRTLPLPQCPPTGSAPVWRDLPVEVISESRGEKKEKCGVFGVCGPADAVERCYYGLYALQHRGQESAGIAASDGNVINSHTGLGLVANVFKQDILRQLTGSLAIGHVRYSTAGSNRKCNAQPILEEYIGGQVAVAHNGNLVNAARIKNEYQQHGHIFYSTSDTEVVLHMLAKPTHQQKPDPLAHVLRHLQGAFSFLFLFADRIEACRDPWGFRPLVIGKTRDGFYCVASETCASRAFRRPMCARWSRGRS